jgi:hypothetical protein
MPIPLLLFSDLRYAASIEGSPPVVIDAEYLQRGNDIAGG